MAKPKNFHLGDRSELLGRYLLSFLGHTVMVERQDDHFGIDMFLKLTSEDGPNLYLDGGEAAFQIKSNRDIIEINTIDRITALYDYNQPMFLAVVNRENKNISIYSLLNRFHVYWNNFRGFTSIEFCEPCYFSEIDWSARSLKDIFSIVKVGKPIIEYDFDSLEGERSSETRTQMLEVLNSWIKVERDAILWKAKGLPLAPLVDRYETNSPIQGKPALFNFAEESDIRTLLGSAKASLDVLRVSVSIGGYCEDKLNPSVIEELWAIRNKLEQIQFDLPVGKGKAQAIVDESYYGYESSDPRLHYYEEMRGKSDGK